MRMRPAPDGKKQENVRLGPERVIPRIRAAINVAAQNRRVRETSWYAASDRFFNRRWRCQGFSRFDDNGNLRYHCEAMPLPPDIRSGNRAEHQAPQKPDPRALPATSERNAGRLPRRGVTPWPDG